MKILIALVITFSLMSCEKEDFEPEPAPIILEPADVDYSEVQNWTEPKIELRDENNE